MKSLKAFSKRISENQSGQGTAEYVLLLAIVVAIIVAFGPRIKEMVSAKVGSIEGGFNSIQ